MRISDWSSDVCSSDLVDRAHQPEQRHEHQWDQDIESHRPASSPLRGLRLGRMSLSLSALTVGATMSGVSSGGAEDDALPDRKSVVEGMRVSVRVYIGGALIVK